MNAFKAYDIRGVYGVDVDEKLAYKLGRRLPAALNGRRVLVGRDARTSSPSLSKELVRGLVESGCEVDDMGLASTSMVYYFTAKGGYDLSVQVTASHNPADCNGFKVSKRDAVSVGYDTGLSAIEAQIGTPLPPPVSGGAVREVDFRREFVAYLKGRLGDVSGLDLTIDCSDGMGALTARDVFGDAPHYMADVPDGRFPSHPPNPLEEAGRAPLCRAVVENGSDAGLVFDGDADRVMFVDEKGRFVRPDLMIAVMARKYLRENPGASIVIDIRTSRSVSELVERLGGKVVTWRVGHAFATAKLRETGAVYGGEFAGHYYFRDFFCSDSGELAAIVAVGEIAAAKRAGRPFSAVVDEIDKYANSGELNYKVERKDEAIAAVCAALRAEREPLGVMDFDGFRFDYEDWWMNIRKSNTEPYLRLLVEAKTPEMLAERRAAIEAVLEPFAE